MLLIRNMTEEVQLQPTDAERGTQRLQKSQHSPTNFAPCERMNFGSGLWVRTRIRYGDRIQRINSAPSYQL